MPICFYNTNHTDAPQLILLNTLFAQITTKTILQLYKHNCVRRCASQKNEKRKSPTMRDMYVLHKTMRVFVYANHNV